MQTAKRRRDESDGNFRKRKPVAGHRRPTTAMVWPQAYSESRRAAQFTRIDAIAVFGGPVVSGAMEKNSNKVTIAVGRNARREISRQEIALHESATLGVDSSTVEIKLKR